MNTPFQHFKTSRGISLLEVLLSMLILSAGILSYAKSHSNQITAGQDNLERQQAALIASDINNMIAAHVNTKAAASSTVLTANEIRNAIKTLQGQLLTEATKVATARGYSCKDNVPTLGTTSTNGKKTTATALQSWVQGPAFCLVLEIPPNQVINSNFTGVWIRTVVHWQPLKRADNSTDNMSISSLIAPM